MLLIGRDRGKGQIRKIPGESPDKSGKSRKNRESPKKDKKGRTSPNRETPPFETPPFGGPQEFGKILGKEFIKICFPAFAASANIGGAEMTIILSDNNSRILTAPQSDPLEGGRGVIVHNYCHCISWEKAMTIKMRLSKMLFFLCFRPTIKFQDVSPVDPLLDPPADPLLTRPLKNYFYRHFGVSENMRIEF